MGQGGGWQVGGWGGEGAQLLRSGSVLQFENVSLICVYMSIKKYTFKINCCCIESSAFVCQIGNHGSNGTAAGVSVRAPVPLDAK